MLYVALVEATALIVLVSLFSQMLRSVLRSSARREDALIDKVLHTAGMPWTPAPADRQSQEPIDWEEQMERLQRGRDVCSSQEGFVMPIRSTNPD